MATVSEKIEKLIAFINAEIDTEDYKRREKKTFQFAGVLMIIVTSVMALINSYTLNNANVSIVSVVAVLIFAISWLVAIFFYNDVIVRNMILMGFVILFTYLFIDGSTKGTAIYWILVIPFVYMSLFNFKQGLMVGTYFACLVIFSFWTPIRNYMPYLDPVEVTSRFPLMYICCFSLAFLIGYKSKGALLSEVNRKYELEEAVGRENKRVERLSLETITSITSALDARDEYTHRHSEHVAFYSVEIGRAYGLTEDTLAELATTARLHDIGKIGIRDNILNKRSGLSDEEYEVMKNHVEAGAKILSAFETIQGLDVGALYHHERFDGNGYPHQLKGKQIPLFARIIAVADALDAMYTTRIYREKAKKETVISQLNAGRGTQFDPEFAGIAVALIEDGMLERMEEAFDE